MQFATHAVLFVFVNAALWLTRFPAAVVVTMLWTAGVAIHLLNLIVAEAREAAIAREIERERQRRVQPPRRARTIQLSDEGELLDIIEDEWEVEEKRKRR